MKSRIILDEDVEAWAAEQAKDRNLTRTINDLLRSLMPKEPTKQIIAAEVEKMSKAMPTAMTNDPVGNAVLAYKMGVELKDLKSLLSDEEYNKLKETIRRLRL